MLYPIYRQIARLQAARLRCLASNNAWQNKHEESIENIIDTYFPHGSGLDTDIKFDYEKSNGEKLIFYSSYHVIDEYGYYDGWIDFSIIIKPSLEFDYHMDIKGNFGNFGKDQDLKEHLYEIFTYTFDKIIE